MVSSYFSLLIQSPGVLNGHTQGSPTCINRTAANERLADWLFYGRQRVQGEHCQTDTSSLYSFSNKRDRTQLVVGVSKPYTYILGGENTIRIEVVSNLYNALQGKDEKTDAPFTVPYVEKSYGIWEGDGKKCVVIKRT